jgi:membrane-bound lytic murein transglycosylase D
VQAIQASEGETASALAARAEVSVTKFLKWNDMDASTKLVAGEYYFLGKKRGRAQENFHKAGSGENLWSISQRYGVQLKKLKRFNRTESNVVIAGTMLYLASTRPKAEELSTSSSQAVVIDQSETFNWDVNPSARNASQVQDTVTLPAMTASTESTEPSDNTGITNNPPEVVEDPMTSESDSLSSVASTPAQTIFVQPKKTQHIVQAKETLYSIAKIYNVGVMDLVRWNDLDLQQGLKIGQVLKVTDMAPVSEMRKEQIAMRDVVHEVKSSDTLYSIARLYGVTIKDLMDWNQKKDFSLSVGEKLKIQQRQ